MILYLKIVNISFLELFNIIIIRRSIVLIGFKLFIWIFEFFFKNIVKIFAYVSETISMLYS